jgi:hypothetical protein
MCYPGGSGGNIQKGSGEAQKGTPDLRREGYNQGIEISDAFLSACAVFFFSKLKG